MVCSDMNQMYIAQCSWFHYSYAKALPYIQTNLVHPSR